MQISKFIPLTNTMQLTQPKIFTLKNIVALIILVLCANWFFTFQLVCLKDDNSFYYMPMRMYLSDALHTEGLPYWNPFLMNGTPQHADMQGAVWNPFALVLAYFFHYNHTLFLFEYILYITIAAIGMYRLMSLLTKDMQILFLASIIYICCGFVSGIGNFINWTASLAFIPWIFYFFYVVLQQPTLKKSIGLGISCWLMIVCGYPAFFIYAMYILLTILIWQWRLFFITNQKEKIIASLKYFLVAVIIALVLALPAWLSYVEFLPYYNRGNNLATDLPFRDCFYPQFLVSLLVPTSVYNKTFDELCHSANRDIYFGILPFLLLILFISNYKKLNIGITKMLAAIAVFTFIFLFGFLTPLGNITFNYFPLLGTSKWSAAVRIFLIIIFIAAIVTQLKSLGTLSDKKIKLLRIASIVMLSGVGIISVYVHKNFLFETPTHHKIFIANAVAQMVFCTIAILFIKKIISNRKLLITFIILDLFINYTLGMAITSVGNVPPKVFNAYSKEFYKQNADNYLSHPLANNRPLYMFDPWKNHNASKIMNGATFLESNTVFATYEKMFLIDTANESILRNHAFVFSEDVNKVLIKNIHLGYNTINIKVNCSNAGNIILQQNNYYRWQETHGLPINTWRNCFMQIPVTQGDNEINLVYNKGNYPLLAKISVGFLFLVSITFFSIKERR